MEIRVVRYLYENLDHQQVEGDQIAEHAEIKLKENVQRSLVSSGVLLDYVERISVNRIMKVGKLKALHFLEEVEEVIMKMEVKLSIELGCRVHGDDSISALSNEDIILQNAKVNDQVVLIIVI